MALPTISLRDPQASTPITDDELYRGTTSVLRQGWNSGLKGVGSQLNSVAGLAGEVLGADEFAQNRNADALRLREEAAALAPTIGKWSQVNGLRDFGDYAAGLIGGSAPVSLAGIGAAAATGGGAVPAMLAAGAVNVLPEMGDVIQKQQADPEAMRLSAGERFGSAALGGLGSAAFQGVVPGLVGGKLMGQGAQAAARQSFKGVLAKDVLGASALEGVAEGGGDVVKQYAANPNAAVDWESAKENAIGGAVAGGAMGSIGAAGDLTSRVGPQVGNALSSARTSIKERISGASDAAVESPAGKKVKSAYDDVAEMVEKGRAKFDDTVGKMLRGEELGVDPAEWAKATTDEAKARLTALSDSEGVKAATKWGKEMLDDVGLDAGKRQEVADVMANVAEKGGQMAMAGLRQTWEASKSAASKLDGLMQDLGGKYRGARTKRNNADVDVESSWVDEPGAEPGEFPQLGAPAAEAPKKSMNARREFIDKLVSEGVSPDDARAMYVESLNEPRADVGEPPKFSRDYSGVEQSILNALTANGLSQRRPDLFEDPRNRQKLGASLRQVLDQITTGQLDAKVVRKLTNLLGDDTEGMINSMRRAVKGDLDAGEAESFFKNINTLRDAQQSSEELNTQLKSLMSPEAVQQFGSGFSLMETADLGMAFARGELVSATDSNNRSAKELSASDIATNAKVKEFFVQRFGDKADAALDLIGESVGMKRTKEGDFAATVMDEDGNMKEAGDASFNEKGERQSAENLDVVYVGAGKDDRQGDKGKAELMMHPDLFKSSKQPGMNRAQQAMMNAKDRFSKDGGDPRTVRFEYAEGSTTHGHVVAERAADPEGLSEQDVKAMKNDSKAFSRSPDRIDIPASKATGGEPIAIDTWKVAHVMHGRLERGALDNNSTPERMARMFIEGVARLTEKYGTFTIPDKVRIARLNGVDLTWGEAKKLGKTRRTAADRAYDRNTEQMNDARKELMSLKPGDDARRYELESLIKSIEDDREVSKAEEFGLRTVRGPGGKRRVIDTTEGNGRNDELSGEPTDPDKAGNIHIAAKRLGGGKPLFANAEELDGGGEKTGRQLMADKRDTRPNEKLINKSNMDGSGHYVQDRANFLETMRATARDMARPGTAGAKAMGAKLEKLLRSDINLAEKDQERMLALTLPEVNTARKAEILSELTEKYSDVLRKRGPQKIGKVIAGKEQKTPEYEGEFESDDYSSSEPYFDAPLGEPGEAPSAATVTKPAVLRAPVTMLEKAVAQRMKALTPQSAAAHESWAQKELASGRARNGDEAAALNSLIETARGTREGSPDPKSVAAKKAAFLSRAASGDKALLAELSSSTDAKGLQRAAEALPAGEALDTINARLSELVQDEGVAYGLGTQSYSNESTDPTKNNAAGVQPGKDIKAYIEKVLGKSVKLAWAGFTHAGEFQRMKTGDIIRLSVHALNPMSTAYHESLHAFVAQLRDAGAHDVVDVLYKAARAPQVLKQLNEIYKDQPAVLEQLKDPEERVAYMYQVWASGSSALTVGPVTRNVFQKMADFIRSVLGIWSNDQRALHIMRYFNDGSYAQSMGMPNATHRALMDPGRNKAIEMAKTFTVPLGKLADALLSTGDARLRDTNIPALRELADLIKRSSTEQGGDQGYIPAARLEATKRMGAMAEALAGYSPEDLQQALQALQTKTPATTPEATAAVVKIKAILRDTKNYMEFAGVKLGDLGPDYFPRVWDTHYVSQNEQALRDMLEPYVRSGEFKGNPSDFIRSLTSRAGNEFGIETSTPGMQFKKKRELDFLKPADVAPFLEKDLMGVMASYIGQATRRAEWDRRLGQFDEDTKETKLMALMRQAKAQGASTEQLNMTTDYLKGVDGTLGDSINPHARRIMGNMIVYQNIRLLPMAMFSMLIDPMGVLVRGGTVGEAFKTFKRGMASIPETYGRKTQADEATKLAELVGVIDTAVLNHVMGDVYTQGMVGGTAKKINNMFFKYNMVEGLNRSFRVGASEAAMSFIARHADLKGRHSKRWMAELGLVAGDVVMVGNRIALTQAEGLTPSQERRVHAAINQWVDGAMLRPDAADKPIWMNDPHYALISHLKQFVFSFQKTILNRMVHELKHGNYAPAMALASYVPMMIAADTAKGLIQNGGDEPEWKKSWGVAEYVGYGVQRAGLLGVGQFGLDVVSDAQRGGSGIGALAGPTLEQMVDAVQLLGGRKQFGPMLLDAMPANALYKDVLGGDSDGGPMRTG